MKVLIADDEPVARRLLQNYLEQWGYSVVAARDGAEAWRLFQANHFSMVISDWMMPEMDGIELIGHIRSSPQQGYVYTILVTALTEKQDLVRGMDAGADDFVSKPFDRNELRVRLREGERIIRLEQDLLAQNRALRDAEAALVQSEKLASLGQMAAGMAHEINNPISFVSNNLAVLRRDVLAVLRVLSKYRDGREALGQVRPELAAELARLEEDSDLEYLEQNVERLFDKSLAGLHRVRDIVKNLREFARLDEAEFKDLDLNAAWKSTAEILNSQLEQNKLRLVTTFAELLPIQCQPAKINQVLHNLLLNAIQASPPGSEIELRTTQTDQGVVTEIEDHGCGIAPEHLPHIFEPFFTTKSVGQGMGLGLAIAYSVVRDHGGQINIQSRPGAGSIFRIELPWRAPGK